MRRSTLASLLLVGALLAATLLVVQVGAEPSPAPRTPGAITRVSVASDGTQANDETWSPSISADSRYVAFSSHASNLVPDDNNDDADVFVHDRATGATTRVSIAGDGTEGDYFSSEPSLSGDGRYVAFSSYATNLVPGDTNSFTDVFVHDRTTGETTRVSVASDGSQGNWYAYSPSISADGRYVAFDSRADNLIPNDANFYHDVYVHDRATGEIEVVSVASNGVQANNEAWSPSISADGRYVAFASFATNLTPNDGDYWDVYVHDRVMGETTLVSAANDGTAGNEDSSAPRISADGRFVAFASLADNLVPDDTNGFEDIFVHDRVTRQTVRVSVSSNGTEGNDTSYDPSISAAGRYVAFTSFADNLALGDDNGARDTFVYDRTTRQTTLISIAPDGTQGNGISTNPVVANDGRYVTFDSDASTLVPGDSNGESDVFVYERFVYDVHAFMPLLAGS
jgi:Tol biopolymer transport system component